MSDNKAMSLLDVEPGLVECKVDFPDGSAFSGLTVTLQSAQEPEVQEAMQKAYKAAVESGHDDPREERGYAMIFNCIVGWEFEPGHADSQGREFSFPAYSKSEANKIARSKRLGWLKSQLLDVIQRPEAFYRGSR